MTGKIKEQKWGRFYFFGKTVAAAGKK